MPIYEFECAACGERTDELMRASDPDPVECPKCHAPALRRLLSAPSFRLSGSGWYETDFKSDKDKKRNLAGDSSGGGEAKADSGAKPETASKPAEAAKPSVESKPAAAAVKPGGGGSGSSAT